MTAWRSTLALLGLLALPALVQAGGLEDAWRRFLDQNPRLAPAMPSGLTTPDVAQPAVIKRTDALPLGKNEYVVFVAPGCRRCSEAVAGLRATGANVEVLDVTRSRTAQEAWRITGVRGLPVSLVGRYLIAGWSRPAFEQAMVANVQDETREAQGN